MSPFGVDDNRPLFLQGWDTVFRLDDSVYKINASVYKINHFYRTKARHLEINLWQDFGSKACLLDVLPASIFYVVRIGIEPYQVLRELDATK